MNNKTILDSIGNTPLMKLGKLANNIKANIYVKPEYLNPSGSIKDRVALKMITEAVKNGNLKPGCSIIESSTGNTGIGLSFIGAVTGWPVIIYETTPGNVGELKRKMMRSFGAEVHSLPPKSNCLESDKSVAGFEVEFPGRQLCLELEQSKPEKYWWARQFSNPANTLAHHETGLEILEQTKGKVDIFVASIGTGGTLKGIAEVLRRANPKVRIVGIQPAGSKILITPGGSYVRNEVDGGLIADLVYTPGLVDEVVTVGDCEAVEMARRLRREGFCCGASSGANVLIALREAEKFEGSTVVTILPDNADRYDLGADEHYVT